MNFQTNQLTKQKNTSIQQYQTRPRPKRASQRLAAEATAKIKTVITKGSRSKSNSQKNRTPQSNKKDRLLRNASSRFLIGLPNTNPLIGSPFGRLRTSRQKIEPIDKLVARSVKRHSQQKKKRLEEEKKLRQSRNIEEKQLMNLNKTIRQQNSTKFKKHKKDLSRRLAWGTDEKRMQKYVVQTIERLKVLSRPTSTSRVKKRDRKQLGLEFLDRLPESHVEQLIRKSRRSNSIESQEISMPTESSRASSVIQNKIEPTKLPTLNSQTSRFKNLSLRNLLDPKQRPKSRPFF